MDPAVLAVLGPHAAYFEPADDGRVKSLVNGHCFPAARVDQIAAFVK
jgi:hypothetical protein